MADQKITIEDLHKVKDAIGESQIPLELTVIANSVVPDHVIIVSPKMYEALKQNSKPSEQPGIPGMHLR